MNPCCGDVTDTHVMVSNPKDVGRLFTKSHYGLMAPMNRLKLNFVEAAHLLSEEKLRVFNNGNEMSFEEFVKMAANSVKRFETLLLSYSDLRTRGHSIVMADERIPMTYLEFQTTRQLRQGNARFAVKAIAERDLFDIDEIIETLNWAKCKDNQVWFSIVDEEGDITYYHVKNPTIKGEVFRKYTSNLKGLMLMNRVVVFDKNASELHSSEFIGKSFGEGWQFSHVEAVSLLKQGILSLYDEENHSMNEKEVISKVIANEPDLLIRLAVYEDLKKKGMVVKTGFKFGTHFRAYSKMPGKTHAEFLVHAIEPGYQESWAVVGRAIRLAHSVNKEMVFAIVSSEGIVYISFGRLRP